MDKWIEVDYTDAGMSDGAYAGAKLYDDLLNKYYKKLLEVLKPDDKKVLNPYYERKTKGYTFLLIGIPNTTDELQTMKKLYYCSKGFIEKRFNKMEAVSKIKIETAFLI